MMRNPRTFKAASVFVLLVVSNSWAHVTHQKQPTTPNTVSKAVRAACDATYAVAAKTPGVSARKRTGTFRDETLHEPVFACGLAISGSFARLKGTSDAAVRLREDFVARGWQEMAAYSADGKDGTSFAFRNAGVSCLVRGTWDGGADGEPEIPALDPYKITVFCSSPEFPEQR